MTAARLQGGDRHAMLGHGRRLATFFLREQVALGGGQCLTGQQGPQMLEHQKLKERS